jgi:hypothetical protein
MTQISLSVVLEEGVHLFHARRVCKFINIADVFEAAPEGAHSVKDELQADHRILAQLSL